MRRRTRRIAMLLSTLMLVNSMDYAVFVEGADLEVVETETETDGILQQETEEVEEVSSEFADEDIISEEIVQETEEVIIDEEPASPEVMSLDEDENEGWYAYSKSGTIDAPIGEKIPLAVMVDNNPGTLSYQWYKIDSNWRNEKIIGATESIYEIVAENKDSVTYKCEITNTVNTSERQSVYFYVTGTYDYGTLKCWALGEWDENKDDIKEINVKAGEQLQLGVYAETTREQAIIYEWYKKEWNAEKSEYEWNKIDGASENIYTKVMDENDDGGYKCIVTDGKSILEKQFEVNEIVTKGLLYDYEVRATGSLVNDTILEAKATSTNGQISYKWFYGQEENKNGKVLGTSKTLKIGPMDTEYEYYQCYITDGKEEGWITFEVEAGNGIEIENPVENPQVVVVPKGQKATLTVKATAEIPGQVLTYGWGLYNDYGFDEDLGTEATFVTDKIDTVEMYVCTVSVDEHNYEFVKFIVVADNLADKLPKDLSSTVEVPSNGSAEAVCINHRLPHSISFKFIPDRSGIWKMTNDTGVETIYIYDRNDNLVAQRHAGDPYSTKEIESFLMQGNVYYISLFSESGYGAYTLNSQYLGENNSEYEWETLSIKKLPTCTENGEKVIKSTTKNIYNYSAPIPALGHISNEEWTVEKEATCLAEGKRYRTCSRCGERIIEVLPKKNHTYSTDWKIEKEATCTENGKKARTCAVCGEKETMTIQATGKHTFGEYVEKTRPTVLAEGLKVRTCSVCGQTEQAAIPKLNGTIQMTTNALPLQVKKNVQIRNMMTNLSDGDYVATYKSDNEKVAVVDANGKVTGKGTGTANIKITLASGVTASVKVSVQKKAVTTSRISGVLSAMKLNLGEKQKLSPVITPITSKEKITYTSSNKKVVTVSANGTITAKKSGTAKITVKSGKKKVTVKVTVLKKAPTEMKGIPTAKTLKKGKTFTIKAKLVPAGADAKIKYNSSNKGVATVDGKGKVKAKKAGTAIITITAGGVKKTCEVTVK